MYRWIDIDIKPNSSSNTLDIHCSLFFFYINFLDTIPIEKGGESIFTILETVYFVTFSMDKM